MPEAISGLPFQIGIASRSTTIDLAAVTKVVTALNLQVTRDFAPIWGISASVVALANPDLIDPGIWPIFIDDDVGADVAGFHFTKHNQPYARIMAGTTWSLTASHEMLELLADPTGNRLYPSVGIGIVAGEFQDRSDAKFEYLVEVCDPSQDPANAYLINDVMVADFYTPRYFDPVSLDTVRYSFSGRIKRPRQVLNGGYLSWLNTATGKFQQARWFDRPEIVDIQMPSSDSAPALHSLRGVMDRQMPPGINMSKLNPDSALAQVQDERQNWLGVAAAARASLYGASRKPMPATVPPVDLAKLVEAHRAELGIAGVISARPGWKLANGWLQSQRVIVVIADPAHIEAVQAALPAQVGGVPLDIRPAGAQHLLRANRPQVYAALASGPRQEYALPDFPGEIRFNDDSEAAAANVLGARRPKEAQLAYTRPAGVTLDPVEEDMTLELHASPDAGWAKLQAFLTGGPPDLVVGMYDFTAPHIEAALLQGRGGGGALTLTLDHPPGKNTREQTIDQTRSDLDQLGGRLTFAWALEGHDPKAAAFIYPNAYHIKVAVRPDDVMWLSSGNWNTSNQPVIDLSDREAAIKIAQASDRDWHVIAHSPRLCAVFRTYLEEDSRVALLHQSDVPAALAALAPEMVPPELMAMEASKPARSVSFFPPHSVTGRMKVRPLLTPQDYQGPILELIQSATTSFWMQTQYIKPSGRPGDEDHDALIAALAERLTAGIDMRLITSTFETPDVIEKLMDAGVDQRVLRLQPQVHNKGMIVDGKTVVISSQNWSSDGTLRNRDAGIIIYDNPEAAQYYEQIFLHDWAHLAKQQVGQN